MQVEVEADGGGLLVRDSLIAAFFSQRPYPELATAYGQVFEQWLAQTPADAKWWAIVGAHGDEYKPFKQLARARAEFDPARAKTRDMSALELGGPQQINPAYRFTFLGSRDLRKNRTNLLEIRSPSSEADAANVERYVESVRSAAALIPFDSGYASLALTFGAHSQQRAFASSARKWAFRHPGFDMANNQGVSAGLGKKLRGAYWLTFVGPLALEQLGGEPGLRRALPGEIAIETVGAGLMLRAGNLPEVGDVNKNQRLPLLRAMAKVLEPVLRLDDAFLDNVFIDDDERARWERRHLDGSVLQ